MPKRGVHTIVRVVVVEAAGHGLVVIHVVNPNTNQGSFRRPIKFRHLSLVAIAHHRI